MELKNLGSFGRSDEGRGTEYPKNKLKKLLKYQTDFKISSFKRKAFEIMCKTLEFPRFYLFFFAELSTQEILNFSSFWNDNKFISLW